MKPHVVFGHILTTAIILGPLGGGALLIIMGFLDPYPLSFELLFFFFFIGSFCCFLISLAGGLVFFFPISWLAFRYKDTDSFRQLFEKYLPLIVFPFGSLFTLAVLSSDRLFASVALSSYVVAVTGWYLYARSLHRLIEKEQDEAFLMRVSGGS